MIEEFWESIEEYPNYAISNYGTVINLKTEKELKQTKNAKGYLTVRLSKTGQRTTFLIHNLVAGAFFLNYKKGAKVRHKNGIKSDNTVLNLTLTKVKKG